MSNRGDKDDRTPARRAHDEASGSIDEARETPGAVNPHKGAKISAAIVAGILATFLLPSIVIFGVHSIAVIWIVVLIYAIIRGIRRR